MSVHTETMGLPYSKILIHQTNKIYQFFKQSRITLEIECDLQTVNDIDITLDLNNNHIATY